MASRDELLDQVVSLKKKYVKYHDYADATINDIFSKEKISKAQVLYCDELSSGILYNSGNNTFSFKPFPVEAQVSKVFAIVADDFDKDGKKDIVTAGNFYAYRVQLGRSDASLGQWLKGGKNENITAIDPQISGAYIDGDVRAMVQLKNSAGENLIVVAKNNDAIQVLKVKGK
jgi:hypothetical protein